LFDWFHASIFSNLPPLFGEFPAQLAKQYYKSIALSRKDLRRKWITGNKPPGENLKGSSGGRKTKERGKDSY